MQKLTTFFCSSSLEVSLVSGTAGQQLVIISSVVTQLQACCNPALQGPEHSLQSMAEGSVLGALSYRQADTAQNSHREHGHVQHEIQFEELKKICWLKTMWRTC